MFISKSKIQNYFSRLKTPYANDSINWVWKFFRNKEKNAFIEIIKDLDKQNCLDLGAGSCEYAKILLQMGAKRVTCVDFSSSLMSFSEDSNIEKVISDVETFETSKKYNLILCMGILEFLDKPKDFIIKLKTFLKPKGLIVILLPQTKLHAFIYKFFYLLRGVKIHSLSFKEFHNFLIQKKFQLKKKEVVSQFSIMGIYSATQSKK